MNAKSQRDNSKGVWGQHVMSHDGRESGEFLMPSDGKQEAYFWRLLRNTKLIKIFRKKEISGHQTAV